jgi:serine/threonine protein kinase
MDFSLTPDPIPGSRGHVALAPGSGRRSLVAEIYVYIGQDLSAKYAIEHGEYIIGRDEACNITVDAERVSRHHARLIFNAYEVVLEDLESLNGVFIDGIQLQLPTRVYPEQEVQIGAARLFIHLDADSTKELRDSLWDSDLGLAPVRQQLEGARYKVLTTLARGGMGVVLQARDLRVRRTVAMKVMKAGAQFSKENVLRFIDEAQLTGQLDHPNIVPVYELGIDERGEAFYTMKYVKGTTLDEVLRGLRSGRKDLAEKYPLAVLLTVFQKICDAVAFAHAKSVIHRDLKPENVMIGAYGEVLVMDWGLAKQTTGPSRMATQAEPGYELKPRHPLRAFETMHGVVIGTPPFVSPEQARGDSDAVDTRSDVYVLGAILYAILTLRAPVEGLGMEETLSRIIESEIKKPTTFNAVPVKQRRSSRSRTASPEPPKATERIELLHCPNQRIPEGLSAIVMKAMELEPANRYQSVVELQADLTMHQAGFATKAERAGMWRQALLFGGRHKRELSIFLALAIVIQALLVAFIVALSRQKNEAKENARLARESALYARASEVRAKASEEDLGKALTALRGTAPTYAQEAKNLLDDQKLESALEKIDYAIEQVPNEASYLQLRGNILQSLMRFNEALTAYNESLARSPKNKEVKDNIAFTKELIARIPADGSIPPSVIQQLHAKLVDQKRVGEALAVATRDQKLFVPPGKAALDRRGNVSGEKREDGSLYIDLSRESKLEMRRLRFFNVTAVNFDDTRLQDLSAIKGLPLTALSLGHTMIRDLSPLAGMPLRALNIEGTQVIDLAPLAGMPLENLRMGGTRVPNLNQLVDFPLEQLSLNGCREITDLTPLAGLPLQKVDLSRTSISDLKPLVQSPIRELDLEGCVDLMDLKPLMQMKTLETVRIPTQCVDIAYLRGHPTIKRLSYRKMTQPVEEFWAEWEAGK